MGKTANSQETVRPWLFKKGQSGNPSGRPKGTLKDYVREKFIAMSKKDKDAFLKKIPPETLWKMGEGNPHQTSEENVRGTVVVEFHSSLKK